MKIIQISDLHLPSATETRCAGFDTLARCRRLVRRLMKENADLLVITGDVSTDTENSFCYRFLRHELESLPYAWVVLPGNHDRGMLFREIFGRRARTGFDIHPQGNGSDVVFFDNSHETPHHLPSLKAYLGRTTKPVCLFTHYPPIMVGHPTYDGRHRLAWQAELLSTMRESASDLYVFFGHIHFAFNKTMDRLRFHSVPSGTLPVIQGENADLPDRTGLYFREITRSKAGWETTLRKIA